MGAAEAAEIGTRDLLDALTPAECANRLAAAGYGPE